MQGSIDYSWFLKPHSTLRLANSASDQNVYLTYVCLISGIKPNDNLDQGYRNSQHALNTEDEPIHESEPIQVERSKALHELIETHRQKELDATETSGRNSTPHKMGPSETNEAPERNNANVTLYDNPNVLKLTKMKWLSEDQRGHDSSSPSITPTSSLSTICSDDDVGQINTLDDKYLSTILKLDKEHNLFGLSNITIVGTNASKLRRKDEKPVFHQTAIVQVCCGKVCCKHKSNTDLPASLKCSGCRKCCSATPCLYCCRTPCAATYEDPPCTPQCTKCPRGKCYCKLSCAPSKCTVDCGRCFGFKLALKKKPVYEPLPIELTPRSSSVLQKPMAARSCHHVPHCIPPSSCFPYLMPCFWPARPSAPCSVPARCFHNPPCLAPRKHQCPIPNDTACPKSSKCDRDPKKKCQNYSCLGKSPITKTELEKRFSKGL